MGMKLFQVKAETFPLKRKYLKARGLLIISSASVGRDTVLLLILIEVLS